MEAVFWLAFFLLSLVVEIATVGLVSIWFAAAALVSFVLAAAGAPLWSQILTFFLISILTLVAVRPIAQRFLNKKTSRTNVDALVGKPVRIIETVDNVNGKGRAVLNGMEWTARSADGSILEEGSYGIVTRIEGVKLILSAKHG